ncbi:MAG: hypothetical protein AseanaTS_19870 [Candidatus Pelagadaptatus aseana]|uniref:TMEM143 family protein n=1 Tax=Candidatus Pelagadaptatus aseana TaxID=3120508 RepID=UPI0039B19721
MTHLANFIPFRKRDIIEMCLHQTPLNATQQQQFRQLAQDIQRFYHADFHQLLEQLKDSYAPINPDADTRNPPPTLDLEPTADFSALLKSLLDKANYDQLSEQDIQQAFEESSLFDIRLSVDFSPYEEVLLFCRGASEREEVVNRLGGLYKKKIRFTNYDRVVIFIRFKQGLDSIHSQATNCRPGATLLKLFQNVPKADLEMLFPNTRVGMRLIDKLMIGVPAAISGGIVLTTKLGTTLVLLGSLLGYWLGMHQQSVELDKPALLALAAGLGTLGAYLWKQFSSFKNKKLRFTQALTENLYFKSLDNNAGVFHRLLDAAEEEECKEAILAYYFLQISEVPVTQEQLDQTIEQWFKQQWDCDLDFEVDDALNKLERLQLVNKSGNHYSAKPLP